MNTWEPWNHPDLIHEPKLAVLIGTVVSRNASHFTFEVEDGPAYDFSFSEWHFVRQNVPNGTHLGFIENYVVPGTKWTLEYLCHDEVKGDKVMPYLGVSWRRE